ncbi:MAG: exopolysaccharide biosynthesis polyprenyl glycosylphosphotransferase [Rubricoccaceae bacterium]
MIHEPLLADVTLPRLLTGTDSYAERLALARAQGREHRRRALLNGGVLALAEALALAGALVAGGLLRQALTGETGLLVGAAWAVVPTYLAAALGLHLLPGWGLGAVEELRRSTFTLLGVFGLTFAGLWLAGPEFERVSSRFTLGAAGLISLGLVPFARSKAKALLVRRDAWGVPVAVYGAGEAGARIVRQLQEERGMGYTPIAVLDDDPERQGDFLDTVPVMGRLDAVVPDAALAFLALPEADRHRQIELLEGPLAAYRSVVVVPDLFEVPSLWVRPRDIAGVLGLELASTLTRPLPRALKRFGDLAAVVLTAPLWAPLLGLLALLVRLGDGGAALYYQERIGVGGRTFRAAKLRTMVPDAERALERALAADPALRAEWEATFKLERDPRVTRVGALLRRTSLDELPQLLNVLRGEMSLVGPRPLPRYHHEELSPRVRALRERVRPGITGLWQVSGRSDAGNAGMERWDPYYVRNWSPWLDAVILVRTFRVVLRGSGAY